MGNKKKPNFNLTFKDYSKRETLCLMSLSDAWRRGAEFDRPKLAAQFNQKAKELCKTKSVVEQRKILREISDTAAEQGINRVILPVYGRSKRGKDFRNSVLNKYDGALKMELQNGIYRSAMDHLGKVDGRRRTAFDYGAAKIR